MKYYLKKLSILYLVCSIFLLFTSCNKHQVIQPASTSQNETMDNGEKAPVLIIAAAIVFVIVHVTEGKYHKETIVNADGSSSEREWCEGNWGHCSINVSKSNGTFVSSQQLDEDIEYDYFCNASLIKSTDGKVVLKINNDTENINTCKNFFYDRKITISRPLTIDRVSVLNELKHDKPITIQGEYKVYDDIDGQYIIIE